VPQQQQQQLLLLQEPGTSAASLGQKQIKTTDEAIARHYPVYSARENEFASHDCA
jgi:hypothetical protein